MLKRQAGRVVVKSFGTALVVIAAAVALAFWRAR